MVHAKAESKYDCIFALRRKYYINGTKSHKKILNIRFSSCCFFFSRTCVLVVWKGTTWKAVSRKLLLIRKQLVSLCLGFLSWQVQGLCHWLIYGQLEQSGKLRYAIYFQGNRACCWSYCWFMIFVVWISSWWKM